MSTNFGNCPTCCANRREDRRIVDEGDDGDTYCADSWHATHTPPAPADDASGAEACRVCALDGDDANVEARAIVLELAAVHDLLARDKASATGRYQHLSAHAVSARALLDAAPLPASDDAVEKARDKVVEAARVMHECIHATPYIRAREFAAIQDVEDAVAALLAEERAKGGGRA